MDKFPTWKHVHVTATYRYANGEPVRGSVIFTPTYLDAIVLEDDLVLPRPVIAKIDGYGELSVQLPSTDDPDLSARGWGYTVEEKFRGGRAPFVIEVPHTVDELNLVTAVPATPVVEVSSQLRQVDVGTVVASQAEVDEVKTAIAAMSEYDIAVKSGYTGTQEEWQKQKVAEGFAALLASAGPMSSMYDLRRKDTLFQNMSGLPVTASGQPLGLVLDLLAPTNKQPITKSSDFFVPANWTLGAGWTISNRHAIRAAAASTPLSQVHTLAEGRLYKVEVAVIGMSAGSAQVQLVGTTTVNGQTITAAGEYVDWVVAPAGGSVTVQLVPSADAVMAVASFRVTEVAGFPLYQPTANLRPEYWEDPHTSNAPMIYVDPAISYPAPYLTWDKVGVRGTVGVVTPFGALVYDSVGVWEFLTIHAIFYVSFDRILTDAEKDVLQAYLDSITPAEASEGWVGYENNDGGHWFYIDYLWPEVPTPTNRDIPYRLIFSDGTVTPDSIPLDVPESHTAFLIPLSRTRLKFKVERINNDPDYVTRFDTWYCYTAWMPAFAPSNILSYGYQVGPSRSEIHGAGRSNTILVFPYSRATTVAHPPIIDGTTRAADFSVDTSMSNERSVRLFNKLSVTDPSNLVFLGYVHRYASRLPANFQSFSMPKLWNLHTDDYATFSDLSKYPNLKEIYLAPPYAPIYPPANPAILENIPQGVRRLYAVGVPSITQEVFNKLAARPYISFDLWQSTLPGVTHIPDTLFNRSVIQYVNINATSISELPSFDALDHTAYFAITNSSVPVTSWRGTKLPTPGGFSGDMFRLIFTGLKLSQNVVDALLQAAVNGGAVKGSNAYMRLYLNGAGSSPPSAAGLANKAILVSRGWTVYHN